MLQEMMSRVLPVLQENGYDLEPSADPLSNPEKASCVEQLMKRKGANPSSGSFLCDLASSHASVVASVRDETVGGNHRHVGPCLTD